MTTIDDKLITGDAGRIISRSVDTTDDYQWLIIRCREGIPWSRYHIENDGGADADVVVRQYVRSLVDPAEDTPVAEGSHTVAASADASDHLDALCGCIVIGIRSDVAETPTSCTVSIVARRV